MDFMEEKFKMVLHYIIYKCGFRNNVGRTVLHKLMYFSDFNYFELYNESITNESYRKMERGPVPIHFESAIEELIDESKVSIGKRKLACGKVMKRYYSLKEPSIDLKEEELAVIDNVIKDLSHLNGKQIGDYSLSDAPVKQTQDEEIVDYNLVSSRDSKNKSKVFVKIVWFYFKKS